MRVISGTRKGHKLKAPKGMNVRPTEDKIKESLFNILRNIRMDAVVLDLFAGSGSIGIEFLSRGAEVCYFVDNSSSSISVINENLSHTRLTDNAIVMKSDGLRILDYFHKENIKFDYIYLDPPFRQGNFLTLVLESISRNNILNNDGTIIVEHEKELELKDNIASLIKVDFRNYGSKSITFFKAQYKTHL